MTPRRAIPNHTSFGFQVHLKSEVRLGRSLFKQIIRALIVVLQAQPIYHQALRKTSLLLLHLLPLVLHLKRHYIRQLGLILCLKQLRTPLDSPLPDIAITMTRNMNHLEPLRASERIEQEAPVLLPQGTNLHLQMTPFHNNQHSSTIHIGSNPSTTMQNDSAIVMKTSQTRGMPHERKLQSPNCQGKLTKIDSEPQEISIVKNMAFSLNATSLVKELETKNVPGKATSKG